MACAALLLTCSIGGPSNLGTILAMGYMYRALKASRPVRRSSFEPLARPDWVTFKATHLSTSATFKRYLRVSEEIFDHLAGGIRPSAEGQARAERAGHNSAGRLAGKEGRGGYVKTELRLAMTLRYLAGASYLDLCIIFGVGKCTFYNIVWDTITRLDAFLPALSLEDDMEDVHRCRQLAAGFEEKTRGREQQRSYVRGCIGALDGLSMKIEAPHSVDNPLKYYCRKLFYAVSVQAVCDANRRFTYMSMRCPGSVHDSTAWNDFARCRDGATRISEALGSSAVLRTGCTSSAPWGFFIVADDAYRCCPTVVSPWSTASTGSHEDAFNYQLSRCRINIECSFGMLVNKFLILSRPLSWSFFSGARGESLGVETAPKPRLLLRVCMGIHNLCIERRMAEELSPYTDFSGGYETPQGRAQGRERGRADAQPSMASGWDHPTSGEVPSWEDADADAAMAAPAVFADDARRRRAQIENVSEARVRLTDELAATGVTRPDPAVISANMRAARRHRAASRR